jgi:hypothetical protein
MPPRCRTAPQHGQRPNHRGCGQEGPMPPWLPGLAASGPYAALPVVAWSGRCPGAECAGLNELRGIPALSGARREGQPRLVTTDYVVSRRADMVVAVTAAAFAARSRPATGGLDMSGYVRRNHLRRRTPVRVLDPANSPILDQVRCARQRRVVHRGPVRDHADSQAASHRRSSARRHNT